MTLLYLVALLIYTWSLSQLRLSCCVRGKFKRFTADVSSSTSSQAEVYVKLLPGHC